MRHGIGRAVFRRALSREREKGIVAGAQNHRRVKERALKWPDVGPGSAWHVSQGVTHELSKLCGNVVLSLSRHRHRAPPVTGRCRQARHELRHELLRSSRVVRLSPCLALHKTFKTL